MTMIGAFGGPRPLPSCAIATVVTAEAAKKRATIAYFIIITSGASVNGSGELSTRSVGHIATFVSVNEPRVRELSRKTVDSHFLAGDRSSAETREL